MGGDYWVYGQYSCDSFGGIARFFWCSVNEIQLLQEYIKQLGDIEDNLMLLRSKIPFARGLLQVARYNIEKAQQILDEITVEIAKRDNLQLP